MRILILHPHLNIKGGSERLTKVLLDGLSKIEERLELKLVTGALSDDWFGKYLGITEMLRLGADREEVEERVSNIVRSFEPDITVVMVQEPYYCAIAKSVYAKTKTVVYVHFPIDEEISEDNLRDYEAHLRYPTLTPRYVNAPDLMLCNSRRTKLAIEMLWPIKAEVVYPCIDEVFFEEPDLEQRRDNTILYVGRFNSLKRQDILVSMFSLVKEEVRDCRLVLAGFVDPRHREYYEHVRAIVDSLIDKYRDIELVPSPDDKKLLELYREAKVYVHPRIGEHFGMAPVEAMLQGAIVVIRMPTGLAEVARHTLEAYLATSDHEMFRYVIQILRRSNSELVELRRRARALAEGFRDVSFASQVLGKARAVQS